MRKLSGLGVLVALSLVGCAMETAEDSSLREVRSKEQASHDSEFWFTDVYAFDRGLWRMYEFVGDDTARPARPKRESWFGIEGDRPLLGHQMNNSRTVIIGVYGKYADPSRRGMFYFDTNNNGTWDATDYGRKFLPAAVGVQENDQPFVLYEQLWGTDAQGKCQPREDEYWRDPIMAGWSAFNEDSKCFSIATEMGGLPGAATSSVMVSSVLRRTCASLSFREPTFSCT